MVLLVTGINPIAQPLRAPASLPLLYSNSIAPPSNEENVEYDASYPVVYSIDDHAIVAPLPINRPFQLFRRFPMKASHHFFARYLTSLGMAIVVTAALVWLMQYLIKPGQLSLDESPPPLPLAFLPVVEEEPIRQNELPKKIEPPQLPPYQPPALASSLKKIGLSVIEPQVEVPGPTVGEHATEESMLPIVLVRPDYPVRSASRGIERYVLVEFTVTATGSVVNARVVEAKPEGIFNRSALRAVARYKYKPRVVAGRARALEGVLHRIVFKLEGE